jgi:hypothetical protein
MSKTVVAIVGIAMMVYAPYLVGFIAEAGSVAFTYAGYYATLGAITLAGASLAGSAMKPTMPDMQGVDNYAGQKLQTRKDNTSAVPEIFGENRLGGNIIWQVTGVQVSANDNEDYWAIIAIGNGELNQFLTMYSNEDAMVAKGSNVFTTTYAHIKAYTTSGASGMNISDVSFVKNSNGDVATWGSLNTGTLTSAMLTLSSNWISYATDDKGYLLDGDLDTYIRAPYYSTTGLTITWSYSTAQKITLFKIHNYQDWWTRDWIWQYSYFENMRLQYYNGTSWVNASNIITTTTYGWSIFNVTEINAHTDWRLYIGASIPYSTSENDYTPCLSELVVQTEAGGTSAYIPANVSFLAVHQVFDSANNKHTQLDNITALVQGKKIDGTYSNNPATIIKHLLTDGLSIPSSAIDTASFDTAVAKCNEYGYTCNVVFTQQTNIQSSIIDVLSTCRGQVIFSQGTWKIKIDQKDLATVKTITADDILNSSLSISMKGFQEIMNKVDLKYVNPQDNWLSAKVEKQDNTLISLDGQLITRTLDIKGITNPTQANKLAEITLNSTRYTEDTSGNRIKQAPLIVSFSTTIKNADLEVGDVIAINHSLLDRVRRFIILSVETDQSGVIKISAREYCDTHYKSSTGAYLI